MRNPVQVFLFYLVFLVILSSCQEHDHYDRPASLAPPMYQQLEARGNFQHFLALVDKADYKQTLSEAGYWTLFAPTDDAFEAYFMQEGISSVDEIEAERARGIVTYSLVYNAFSVNRLADYQGPSGWVAGRAYKRKTAFYDGVYQTSNVKIEEETFPEANLVASNRHGGYVLGDNGNKYIPYFTEDVFDAQGISAADYNYFYPNTSYANFNVVDARVLEANISAENGFIHIIDKVIEPLKNIDQKIASNEEYTEFRNVLEDHLTSYDLQAEVSRRYNIISGSTEPVYVKLFNPALVFSPNSESWQDPEGGSFYLNAAQANTNTIFVPKNEAVRNYVNSVLLQYYPAGADISRLPQNVLADFISAHMWAEPVWPTRFWQTRNLFGDPARFDSEADILEKEMLSNGIFYGTDKVLESNVFHSVYGRAYLDPNYTIMIDVLGMTNKQQLTQRENLYTMFLVTDQGLQDAGFNYDSRMSQWVYTPPQGGGATLREGLARQRLERLINQHVAMMNSMDDLADLSGEGLVRTHGGEYIKYENGKLFTAGNQDRGEEVNIVEGPIETENGLVYLLDRPLEISDKHMTEHIEENFEESYYFQFMKNSIIFDPINYTMVGTTAGSAYTILVPTDEAIQAAVDDGFLPANADGTPNFNPSSSLVQNSVANFIRYHTITNEVIVDDPETDLFDVNYLTLYRDELGKTGTLFVSDGTRGDGPTVIRDLTGKTATIVREDSNILSNRTMIHRIDHFLDYRFQ